MTCLKDDISQIRADLREFIATRCISHGNFRLASGKQSSYFVDGKKATLDAQALYWLSCLILNETGDDGIDAIGGMTLGADPIVGGVVALAGCMGIPLRGFIVRKERKDRGMGDQVAGSLGDGDRVVMIEDTITTGGMTLKAIEAVEREGNVTIVKVIAMVDRLQGAREAIEEEGFELVSLFTIDELGVTPQ